MRRSPQHPPRAPCPAPPLLPPSASRLPPLAGLAAALLCALLAAGPARAATASALPSPLATEPPAAKPTDAKPPAAEPAADPDAPPQAPHAAPAPPAERSAFSQALRQAAEAARAGKFDPAAAAVEQAYAATANPYERIRAGDWYASIREEQGRYDLARRALHTIRPLIRCVYGTHDTARSMAQEARLAFLQNKRAEGYALLARIHDLPLSTAAVTWGQPDRDNWIFDGRQARLYYRLAGMGFPATAGGLLREEHETADDRSGSSTLIYAPIAPQGALEGMKVRLRIGSRDRHGTTVAQALAHELSYERELYGDKRRDSRAGKTPEPAPVPAEYKPAGSTHAAGALHIADERGNDRLHGVWIARKGAWQIVIRASWAPSRQAAAVKALQKLFADIGWNADKALYRGLSPRVGALYREFDTALADRQWAQAAALAARILPSAVFPARQARLYTAMGIAAARDGHPAQAMPLLRKAFAKWRYSKLGYGSESLFDTLLLYAADAAFRAGDTQQAVTWLNAHARDTSDPAWKLDADSGALLYLPMNLSLPARLGDFLLASHDRNLARYARIGSQQAIGVTLIDRAPGSDPKDMEDLLRNGMTRNLRLQVGDMTQLPFPDATRGAAHGRLLQFAVTRPAESRAGAINIGSGPLPPTGQRRMTFWLSRIGDKEIVLRTETAPDDAAAGAAAGKAAAAFPWPASADALHPVAHNPWKLACAAPAMAAAPALP